MRSRKNLYFFSILLIGLFTLTACGGNAAVENNDHQGEVVLPEISVVGLHAGQKLAVVATTSIIGDVVANIGGEMIDLTVLIAIGQNPHSFEPTPRDLAAVEDADLLFVNGLDLEEVLMKAIYNTASGAVVPVSAGIELLALDGDHADEEEAHTAGDPHFWVDPNNVIVWAENIAQVLRTADPANENIFRENAESYIAELQALDRYIREQTALIPEANRKIVTDHHSLGYFADEYGYQIVGAVIPSTTDSGGASAGEVAALAELMADQDVRVIFIGDTAGQGMQNLAESLAREIGGEVKIITLLSGSLAPQGKPGDTTLGYLRYNTDQIVSGLTQ